MASLASLVRVTSPRSASWRECKRCTDLAPLAPDETHCQGCLAERRRVSTRRRLPRAA